MTAEEFIAGSWEITPKLMFIRKGGKAVHVLGDLSRDCYNAEPIVVQREDADNWIGYYMICFYCSQLERGTKA